MSEPVKPLHVRPDKKDELLPEEVILESLRHTEEEFDGILENNLESAKIMERLHRKYEDDQNIYRAKIEHLQKLIEQFEANPTSVIEDPSYVVQLQSENLKMSLEVDQLKAEVEDLSNELLQATKKAEKYKIENISLDNQLHMLQHKHQAEADNLHSTLQYLVDNDSPMGHSMDSDEETMDDAEMLFRNKLKSLDIHAGNDGFEDLEALIEDKTNENQELGRRLARQETKFELLKSKLEHMDDDKGKLLSDLEKVQMELMDQKEKTDKVNKEYKMIMAELQNASVQNGELRAQNEIMKEHTKTLQGALDKSETRISNEEASIKELIGEKEDVKKRLDEVTTRKIQLETKLEASKEMEEMLKSQLKDLTGKMQNHAEGEISSFKLEIDRLKEKSLKQENEIAKYKEENEKQVATISSYEDQLDKFGTLCNEQKEELLRQNSVNQSLSMRVDRYKAKIEDLRNNKRKLALSACNEIERLSEIIKQKQTHGMQKVQRAVKRLSTLTQWPAENEDSPKPVKKPEDKDESAL